MNKIIFAGIFQLFVTVAMSQEDQAFLIKANTGRPVDYMNKARAVYKLNKNKVVQYEKRYSFEKKRGETLKVETGKLDRQVVKIKPELKVTQVPQPVISVQAKINSVTNDAGGPDPMVAVGEKTILVGNTSWIKFFDKTTGNVLEETDVTSLFWRYLSPTIPGTNDPNPEQANNFYDLPKDIPVSCSKSLPCGVTDCEGKDYDADDLPCGEADSKIDNAGIINEAYDLRIFYQKEHKRFVIAAAMRNQSARNNGCYNADGEIDCEKYLIRLVAIAVSVSENPADGFYIYRTRENNYRDWPNVAVDQDYLVIAHMGSEGVDGKSIVTVVSFRQMKEGSGSVDGFRIKQNSQINTPIAVIPVQNLLTDMYSQAFFFIENAGSGKIRIWYIKKPSTASSIFQNPPSVLKKAGEISIEGAGFTGGNFAGATFYSNMLYSVSYQTFNEATITKRTGFGLNVFQIPVIAKSNGEYEASKNVSEGFQHSVFEDPDYSYLDPSLAIDVFKNIVIGFVRIPRSKSSSEKPQVRYKVKFSHQSFWQASLPAKNWDVSDEGADRLVHYSWVAKDPFKPFHYWQAHIYKANGKTGTWIQKIDLGTF